MDSSVDGDEQEETKSSPQTGLLSPAVDRNPSPPPDKADGEEDEDLDAIGDTVYSKHWLFSTLTRLINMVAKHSEENSEGQMQLSEDDEEDLCKVWDMAMDKDVAGFLQEFKVADILLGVIAKSRCPRLTEICVGILGNIACFPDTCEALSQNEDLGAVLLLLLGDADPPTLLETSRLLLMCLSQKDVCSLWLHRIRQQASVCSNLCFIMSSSTNTDLLEKVGELVDKLFDLDEELMESWITSQPHEDEEEEDGQNQLDVILCLLEAAKQLRSESPNGLEVYLHILQLLTTVDEGLQAFAAPDGPGKSVWDFVCDIVCEDLCQTNDLSVVFHERKSMMVQTFSVLQALYRCHSQWCSRSDASLPLIGTIFQACQYHKDEDTNKEDADDEQLSALAEITTEFLADLCSQMSKDTVADLIKEGYLTEKTCLAAASCLLPEFKTSFQHLQAALSEVDPRLAEVMRTEFPV
ncbi:protein saal1 [Nematolebias whitei]|uniref:protein saal1 n=1 Tax=Nematolebias whitei TaxID=451745 RepID=UPI00189BF488|nr:protein saal1 [Nematolebias whitei]